MKKKMLCHENIFKKFIAQLNVDQKFIFDFITKESKKMIYIDGPGGTGKTFLYKTLIHYFLSIGKKVLAMAWTGIALILLPNGMTSHKTFKLPLDLTNNDTSFLKLESDKKRLRECNVIVWGRDDDFKYYNFWLGVLGSPSLGSHLQEPKGQKLLGWFEVWVCSKFEFERLHRLWVLADR